MATTENNNPSSVALVVGVTGMAGLGIAQALKNSTSPGSPWLVYGAARRPKPTWFPSSTLDHYLTFDAVNFDDTSTTLSPLSSKITHLFWAAIYVGPNEESNISVNSTMLSNVLRSLTAQPSSLHHVSLQTGTSQYMGPVHFMSPLETTPYGPPFSEDMSRLPHPNFYYTLEDLVTSYSNTKNVTYTILRPSIIIGASCRSVYNSLLTLAVYAEICKHQNAPFRYPGTKYTWEHFCDMTDTRVLGEHHVWGATNNKAINQAFNSTNGDIYSWKKMWGVLCEEFGVKYEPFDGDELFDLVVEMKDKGKVWDQIVEEKGLVKTKMEEITCFGAFQTVVRFNFQMVSSMNKSKKLGFLGWVDSFESVRFWIGKLREMKIIP